MLRIFKYLDKSTPLLHGCVYNFCASGQMIGIVNKYLITRRPNQNYSIYLDTETTVQQFKGRIEELFPKSRITLTNNSNFLTTFSQVSERQQQSRYQAIKNLPFIDTLLHNQLIAYQKNQFNQFLLTYGIQITEYNLSNRLNIPEHIEQGIAQLNYQLSNHRMTVANALSFSNIRKFHDGSLDKQSGSLIRTELNQIQRKALDESIEYLRIIKFIENNIEYRSANKIMYGIIFTLTANFGFLFYITYFYSGWDLGQPLSYLMGLGIDLVALMGVFEANKQLIQRRQQDKNVYLNTFNIKSNSRMAKWRIAHLTRKMYF